MVTTDLKTLKALSKKQLIAKVQETEIEREAWHTRLTEATLEHWAFLSQIKELKIINSMIPSNKYVISFQIDIGGLQCYARTAVQISAEIPDPVSAEKYVNDTVKGALVVQVFHDGLDVTNLKTYEPKKRWS